MLASDVAVVISLPISYWLISFLQYHICLHYQCIMYYFGILLTLGMTLILPLIFR